MVTKMKSLGVAIAAALTIALSPVASDPASARGGFHGGFGGYHGGYGGYGGYGRGYGRGGRGFGPGAAIGLGLGLGGLGALGAYEYYNRPAYRTACPYDTVLVEDAYGRRYCE